MMKAQVSDDEDGLPGALSVSCEDCYGKGVRPRRRRGGSGSGRPPEVYADIRRRGLHAVGTVMTTFIPPQAPVVIEEGFRPSDVPAIGSAQFLEQIHLDTEERRQLMIRRREARESQESSMP